MMSGASTTLSATQFCTSISPSVRYEPGLHYNIESLSISELLNVISTSIYFTHYCFFVNSYFGCFPCVLLYQSSFLGFAAVGTALRSQLTRPLNCKLRGARGLNSARLARRPELRPKLGQSHCRAPWLASSQQATARSPRDEHCHVAPTRYSGNKNGCCGITVLMFSCSYVR